MWKTNDHKKQYLPIKFLWSLFLSEKKNQFIYDIPYKNIDFRIYELAKMTIFRLQVFKLVYFCNYCSKTCLLGK